MAFSSPDRVARCRGESPQKFIAFGFAPDLRRCSATSATHQPPPPPTSRKRRE